MGESQISAFGYIVETLNQYVVLCRSFFIKNDFTASSLFKCLLNQQNTDKTQF